VTARYRLNVVQSGSRKGTARRSRSGVEGSRGNPSGPAARTTREVKPAEERRRDILDAAVELFARRGFNETTVQDIAAAARVATGTVYLYFPSKDHILLALHRRLGEGLAAHVEASAVEMFDRQAKGEPVDYAAAVDTMVEALIGHALSNRDLIEICGRYRPIIHRGPHSLGERHLDTVIKVLEVGRQLGFIHTSDPEMTAHLLDAAISETVSDHITYGEPADIDRLIAATKELVRKTLAPPADLPKGRAAGGHRRS
jgi:AcrR family transcriptional regulator